ncbi:hypothetical protein [Pseudomonas brassicacearum]|uniref:Uncharacterized protein n=1 Tax=Pseudomonas brassicacearum TaxID=930166 RepID=A0AAJ3KTZ5_9PSED|nr:hypothetical protein [Pseudomonas brassicacearum]NUT79847.1 hypothetical protein [Pseudomonas brassicacearum]
MERQDYLKLRFEIHQEIVSGLESAVDEETLTNNLMRRILHSFSAAEVKRQNIAQQFKSFKRNPNTIVPSWAYNNPGLRDRIPTLKEAKK